MQPILLAAITLLAALAASAELTSRQQKDRIALLPAEHRQFLLDVEPIASAEERLTFLELDTDAQREIFITEFWRRRDRALGLTNYAYREVYYERLAFVKETFESVASDRGRIYLLHGPPAEMVDTDCSPAFTPIQVWFYPYLENLGHDARLLFYLDPLRRVYRLWMPLPGKAGEMAMRDLAGNRAALGRSRHRCDRDVIGGAIAKMNLYMERARRLMIPPPVNEEDVQRILRSVVLVDPNAPKLNAEIQVVYPTSDGSKTDAQLQILVPRSELKTTVVNGVAVYTVDIVGEVLRDGKMWEKYRYRFDFPGDIADAKLPIVIDRSLRPAAYTHA